METGDTSGSLQVFCNNSQEQGDREAGAQIYIYKEHMLDINLFHFRVPVYWGKRLLGLLACQHLLADEIVPQLPHPHGCPSFSLTSVTQVITRSISNNQDELWMYLYVPEILWILKLHLKFKITKPPLKITFSFWMHHMDYRLTLQNH